MKCIVIDYGSGNLKSAASALRDVAVPLGMEVEVSADPGFLKKADAIVLPGVGAFGDCMRGLAAIDGMVETLRTRVLEERTPFLGICVGMQLLFERGLEHGTHQGLGWLKGEVVPLTPSDAALKIPHMGWNALQLTRPEHPLLRNMTSGEHAYFVHSFHAALQYRENLLATVDYGGTVTAIVGKDNIMGTQFHPEKSQKTGMRLLTNFLTMAGQWVSR